MKQLLHFRTTLDKRQIIAILQKNTFATENDFETLIYDRHHFSGQVNDEKIRIRNASSRAKNPSPILDVALVNKDNETEVIIQDDTEAEINKNNRISKLVTSSIAVIIFLFGGISAFMTPHDYSLFWRTTIISIAIFAIGLLNSFHYKEKVRLNTKADVDFLVTLLKK